MHCSPTGRLVQSQPRLQNLPVPLSPRERQEVDAVKAAFQDEQPAFFSSMEKMALEARASLAVMSSMRHAGLMQDVARTMAWLAHCEQLHAEAMRSLPSALQRFATNRYLNDRTGAWLDGESPDPHRLTRIAQTVREMLDSPSIGEDSAIHFQYGYWLH